MEQELVKVLESSGLQKSQAETIMEGFNTFFEEVKKYELEAKAILVTDASQTSEIKRARELRLNLKDIRVNAEKVRKERKEFFLRGGKAIDGIANLLKALVVPLEEHLDKQEHFAERMEEERKERVNNERMLRLQPYVMDISVYNLKDMTDEAFEMLFKTSKTAFEAQKAAEENAKKEAEAKAKAEKEEQERIRLENEKLKEENAKKEAELEKERKAAAEKAKKDAAERKKLEDELEAKKKEEAKKMLEEAEKKQLEEAAMKKDRYRKFREENGWTLETKDEFKEENTGSHIILWKKVAVFEL